MRRKTLAAGLLCTALVLGPANLVGAHPHVHNPHHTQNLGDGDHSSDGLDRASDESPAVAPSHH